MSNEEILKEVARRFDDQRLYVDAMFKHSNAVMRDKFDEAREQRQIMIEHQKIANGRTEKLEKYTSLIRWIANNPYLAIAIGAVLYFGLTYITVFFGYEALLKVF